MTTKDSIEYIKYLIEYGIFRQQSEHILLGKCNRCGKYCMISFDDLCNKEARMCFDCKEKSKILLIEWKNKS